MPSRRAASLTAGAAVLAAAILGPPSWSGSGGAEAACLRARQLFSVREAGKVAFRQPSDLVLAGDRLLVLDDLNGRVAVLDLQGNVAGSIPLPAPEGAAWLGIGFGGADQIFLGSPDGGRVVVVDLKGRTAREFPIGEGAQEARAAGILVSRGSCFVADNGTHKIRVFTLEGKPQTSWGGLGEGATQFRSPFRIAQDSLDRLLVTDVLNSRVLVFTPKGAPLAAFGEFGTTEGTLFRPAGLAVLEGDRVLVSDNYFGSLQIFDAQGVYQGVFCADGRPLALEGPTGLATRGSTVYVVETAAGRVSAWELGER